ncbi:MinD/ParA family protein [Megalodesulfovibrio gigas]|uniref:Putative flagellar synthesis regulator n=1 Tax=Megalodesulfovibrio gigas (strain ATCC 19364 / DSM 1382 / NCIMB 9332 / VKM B-1759) TaxID=1121448 RepID=T2G8N8_MEGG1|nr:MinD/ParA family protein [Megalodesulfovibrio gigas]AGW12955.1 putative flagellar synthesis regulator [Megalodesulfovibrio gigas DSM 1382 = ATCC 19364]
MDERLPLVMSVTSGKGGVGKTNISANLAYSLARQGKRVILLDADLGLANVDIVLGVSPQRNLFHLFHEGATLEDILFPTPYGFSILPASSGVADMISLTTGQKLELLEAMDALEEHIDYLIVDTGAGINDNVLYFNLAVQERLVVMTPEPTSLTDAYALIKVLTLQHDVERFRILVNMAPSEKEAKEVYARLAKACDHFLAGVSLDLVGCIPHDPLVKKAVMRQEPVCSAYPDSQAAQSLQKLAKDIATWNPAANLDGNIKFFWKKLLFHA